MSKSASNVDTGRKFKVGDMLTDAEAAFSWKVVAVGGSAMLGAERSTRAMEVTRTAREASRSFNWTA